jgi:hypothetical protein
MAPQRFRLADSRFERGSREPYNRWVPKKSRQAHVPSQIRKRKARRAGQVPAYPDSLDEVEPVFADPPNFMNGVAGMGDASGPVETRPARRLELLRSSREQASVRVVPGQLPTFERAYLVGELRRIALTAGSLLAVIIVLALVLR